MINKRPFFQNLSFRKKILSIYVVCVLLPIFTLTIFYYCATNYKIEVQTNKEFMQDLDKTTDNIQKLIDNVSLLSDQIYYDDEIYSLLEYKDGQMYDFIKIARRIDSIPYSFQLNKFVTDVGFYTKNDSLYRSVSLRKFDKNILKSKWYNEFINSKQNFMVTTYENDYYGNTISVIRWLDKGINKKKDNLLKIDIDMERITELLSNISTRGDMYLIDADNKIICVPNKITSEEKSYSISETFDDNNCSFAKELDFPKGYKVVGIKNNNLSKKIFDSETILFLILTLLNLALASYVIYNLTHSVIKKLDEMTVIAKKLENQEFELVDESNIGNDEIGILAKGLNSAVKKINKLINEVYLVNLKNAEIKQQKNVAELHALQSQINPHFMFNVLEVVRMKSYNNHEFETSAIIKDISKMFRSLITWNSDLISVSDEMVFVNAYLDVQKYCYRDEIDIIKDIDEKAYEFKIPKMSIQVFVENAIVHGVCELEGDKRVELSIHTAGDKLIVTVKDNGPGMSKEAIENIFNKKEGHSSGIGIKNVQARLDAYFNSNYELKISSDNNTTAVTLTISYDDSIRRDFS